MADTFCILPFKHLQIGNFGHYGVCCMFTGTLCDGEDAMSVHTHSLDSYWNSDAMRDLRRAMAQGRYVPGCDLCYQEEASGGLSRRILENETWEKGFCNEERIPLSVVKAEAAATDCRLATLPASLHLDVGNQCNLKCRMCHGFASSRIALDPIHSQWSIFGGDPNVPKTRFPNKEPWYRQLSFVRDELLRQPQEIRTISFFGGEPLIIKEIGDFLQTLVDAGVAQNVVLQVATNGTVTKAPWLRIAELFKLVIISVSIDGYGKYNEYIRFPSRWDTIHNSIPILRQLSNASVTANTTFQAYNALNVVDLFRYFDDIDIEYGANPLHIPEHLSACVLPPRVRRLAAERIREYAETDCRREEQRPKVLALAGMLEGAGDTFDPELLRQFMLMTNDLDVSRGQSLAATDPELVALIRQEGFEWTEETRFAKSLALR
jgi:MoaA/NifB/PqqE/SkfB family radical SAM enzyme